MTDPDWTVARASEVLSAALGRPGGGSMVLAALGDVTTLQYSPAREGGLFRAAQPAQLLVGDWGFAATEPSGVRLEVRHVVRGVALQSTVAGPDEAAGRLAAALVQVADQYGSQVQMEVASALYGIAAVVGLA